MAVEPTDLTIIFNSVKKGLLVPDSSTEFDSTIIIHINTALSRLRALGVGPEAGFVVSETVDETWLKFFEDEAIDEVYMNLIKSYVILLVRGLFDPSASSVISTANKQMIEKYESIIADQALIQTLE